MTDYKFDSRLERAATLPARYYIDPAVLQGEQHNVFARTWQLVGRADQVRASGDFFTTSLAGD